MAQQLAISPFGTVELTLAVGQQLSVQSMGNFVLSRKVNYPNYPSSWVVEAEGSNSEVAVGPYAAITTVRLDGGAWPCLYNYGTAAVAAQTFGGAGPTLNSYVYFDHFTTFDSNEWTITTVEAGSGNASEAITTEAGGWLLLTNDDADDDSNFLQLKGESFKFISGKQIWFEAKLKTNDATQSDVLMGLQITDTTPLDATDGVYFVKNDGGTGIDFVVVKDSTATTTEDVATLANNTEIILGFYWDGVGPIDIRVNRETVGTSVLTNLPDNEELTVSYGIQNGEAAAKTLATDYIRVQVEE